MKLNEYQNAALSTAFPKIDEDIPYLALAMCGEAGEVADKIKKVIRDKAGDFNDLVTRANIIAEIGDVLWYAAVLSKALGYTFSEVAELNVAKIEIRKEHGTIHGSGDNR